MASVPYIPAEHLFSAASTPTSTTSSVSQSYQQRHHQRHHNQINGDSASDDDNPMDGASVDPPPSVSVHDPAFDILDWYPAYESCQRFFLNHAQHEPATQAVCALVNIRLPYQWLSHPVTTWAAHSPAASSLQSPRHGVPAFASSSSSAYYPSHDPLNPSRSSTARPSTSRNFVSPVPYIRRLVVTGFDKPAILHGFFGDDFRRGVMPHVECERRNYLFMAKHGGWRSCKRQYDVGSGYGGDETVPFMKPLDEVDAGELAAADRAWSNWLAMEDWMLGPRAPGTEAARSRAQQAQHQGHAHQSYRAREQNLPDGSLSDEDSTNEG